MIKSLTGLRVLVGRAPHQASALSSGLRALGAEVFEIPFIEIRKPRTYKPLDAALNNIGDYDWLVLTSVNGVDALFSELNKQGFDARHFKAKVAAIGSATARRLNEKGITADLIPPEYVAESIAAALQQAGEIVGRRFLLARADIARSELSAILKQLGGEVTDAEAYS